VSFAAIFRSTSDFHKAAIEVLTARNNKNKKGKKNILKTLATKVVSAKMDDSPHRTP